MNKRGDLGLGQSPFGRPEDPRMTFEFVLDVL
jgi:hypothetical protein